MEYIVWVILSLLFYVVCYLAVLNLLDDATKNSYLKIPAMMVASVPSAFLMAILDYRPIFLFALIVFTNYYRVKQTLSPETASTKLKGLKLFPNLFYFSSYCYIVAMCTLAYYFQMPVDNGDTETPLWKTWLPDESITE